jgi:asparaginyl-tRNA synthetase
VTYAIHDCLSGNVPVNTTITLTGWVKTKRDSKAGLSFIHLHDGSCFAPIQIIAPHTLPNYETELKSLTSGCALSVTGTLIPSPAQGQAYEVEATHIEVVGQVANPERYPIQPKRHTLEYLREVPHLRVRTNTLSAVTRVRHQLAHAIHQFFHERGFYWITTPIITSSDCEGAGELFRVTTLDPANAPKTPAGNVDFSQDFFGKETFLTVSGQLNLEAYCMALSKVYTFGPTFRAENSHTSRHLAEFWMIEPEIAFAGLPEIIQLAEALIHYVSQDVLTHRADDLAFFAKHIEPTCIERLEKLATTPFTTISYTEAIDCLSKAKTSFEFPVSWGLDLQSEHERYLCETVFQCPVVVTDYPKEIKSFYMRLNEDGRTVANMDVLAPGIGEIIGGSARETY